MQKKEEAKVLGVREKSGGKMLMHPRKGEIFSPDTTLHPKGCLFLLFFCLEKKKGNLDGSFSISQEGQTFLPPGLGKKE